jgi:hypothetical protein
MTNNEERWVTMNREQNTQTKAEITKVFKFKKKRILKWA